MPKVYTIHDYPRITVKYIINHLIVPGVDVMVYNAGVEEDCVDVDDKHECQHTKILKEKAKTRLMGDPPLPMTHLCKFSKCCQTGSNQRILGPQMPVLACGYSLWPYQEI